MPVWRIAILGLAAATLTPSSTAFTQRPAARDTFKVATWNVRSGMGIRGFGTTSWTSTTTNCADRSQPLNAWGMGLPQKVLQQIKDDQSIMALAIQEAWRCGSPKRVNEVLGFHTASREQEGVALIARHGFADPVEYVQIDKQHNRWIIGGRVCLDAACSRAVPMFSTHWGGATNDDFPVQAQAALGFLKGQTEPHLFMGDLNIFKIDQWNPKVPCTAADHSGRIKALALIDAAGYVDSWRASQRGEGFTGMASRRKCGSPEGSLYKRIDYIFVRGLQVLSAARFGQVAPGTDSPSDHAGVVAELAAANP